MKKVFLCDPTNEVNSYSKYNWKRLETSDRRYKDKHYLSEEDFKYYQENNNPNVYEHLFYDEKLKTIRNKEIVMKKDKMEIFYFSKHDFDELEINEDYEEIKAVHRETCFEMKENYLSSHNIYRVETEYYNMMKYYDAGINYSGEMNVWINNSYRIEKISKNQYFSEIFSKKEIGFLESNVRSSLAKKALREKIEILKQYGIDVMKDAI